PKSGAPDAPPRAFEVIRLILAGRPAERAHVAATLYGPDRAPVAWSGPSHPIPPELLTASIPGGSTRWAAVEAHGLTRLLALANPFKDSPILLGVEMPIRSLYDPRLLARALPSQTFHPEGDRITFTSYLQPPLSLQELFEREGDRLNATGTERPTIHL